MAFEVNLTVARVGTKAYNKVANPELPTLKVMAAPTKEGGKCIFNINQEALTLLGYTQEEISKGESYVYLLPQLDGKTWVIAGKDAYDTVNNIAESTDESIDLVMKRFSGNVGKNGNFANKILHGLFTKGLFIDSTVSHVYELVKVEDADTAFVYAKLVETTEEDLTARISVTTLPLEVSIEVVDNEPIAEGAFKELLEESATF